MSAPRNTQPSGSPPVPAAGSAARASPGFSSETLRAQLASAFASLRGGEQHPTSSGAAGGRPVFIAPPEAAPSTPPARRTSPPQPASAGADSGSGQSAAAASGNWRDGIAGMMTDIFMRHRTGAAPTVDYVRRLQAAIDVAEKAAAAEQATKAREREEEERRLFAALDPARGLNALLAARKSPFRLYTGADGCYKSPPPVSEDTFAVALYHKLFKAADPDQEEQFGDRNKQQDEEETTLFTETYGEEPPPTGTIGGTWLFTNAEGMMEALIQDYEATRRQATRLAEAARRVNLLEGGSVDDSVVAGEHIIDQLEPLLERSRTRVQHFRELMNTLRPFLLEADPFEPAEDEDENETELAEEDLAEVAAVVEEASQTQTIQETSGTGDVAPSA